MASVRGLLVLLPWLSTTWLLPVLPVLVAAEQNLLAHAYERIYLWTRYDTFTQIEGAKNQQHLFPQRDLNNNNELQLPPRFANTGDGEDGKFTFGQFQARILGIDPKNMPPEDAEKYNSLKAPWSDPDGRTPTIHDVTQRLMEVGLNQRFLVTEFDPTLQRQRFHRTMDGLGRYPPLYDPADPFRTPYSYLIDRIEAQFQKYRAEAGPQHAAVLKKNNDLGLEILRCVVTLRKEDTMKHVFAQMQRDVDDELRPGLSIPLELISVNLEEPSQVPGGKMYPKVRVGITMQNAWNDRATREQLQRKGFTDVEQLYSWANDIGDPTGGQDLEDGTAQVKVVV